MICYKNIIMFPHDIHIDIYKARSSQGFNDPVLAIHTMAFTFLYKYVCPSTLVSLCAYANRRLVGTDMPTVIFFVRRPAVRGYLEDR